MTPYDILWVGSISIAFIITAIVTIMFYRQEGRTRFYLSGMLLSWTIMALISLITAVTTDGSEISAWFKVPRALGWCFIAFMSLLMLLYQLNIIDGRKMTMPPSE